MTTEQAISPVPLFHSDLGLFPSHGLQRYDNKKTRCRCDICRAARREYDQKRYAANREAVKARVRERRTSDLRSARAQDRAKYRRHRDKIRARTSAYYYANRERALTVQKQYFRTDKGKNVKRLNYLKRTGAPGWATEQQIQSRIDYYGGQCAYCREPFAHLDHVIAVARGGTNWPANLRPACEECNLKKGAMPWRQWLSRTR